MHLDPHTTQEIADLSMRLGDTTLRNTVGAVRDRIKAIKTKRDQKEIIQELEEIVFDLIDDKNELRLIAEAYKEKFVAQQISQGEIEYITDTIIPLLREVAAQTPGNENNAAVLDLLESLLSVKMLTVLQ